MAKQNQPRSIPVHRTTTTHGDEPAEAATPEQIERIARLVAYIQAPGAPQKPKRFMKVNPKSLERVKRRLTFED